MVTWNKMGNMARRDASEPTSQLGGSENARKPIEARCLHVQAVDNRAVDPLRQLLGNILQLTATFPFCGNALSVAVESTSELYSLASIHNLRGIVVRSIKGGHHEIVPINIHSWCVPDTGCPPTVYCQFPDASKWKLMQGYALGGPEK